MLEGAAGSRTGMGDSRALTFQLLRVKAGSLSQYPYRLTKISTTESLRAKQNCHQNDTTSQALSHCMVDSRWSGPLLLENR